MEKNQLEARLNVEPYLNINGDGSLLARVFENLITNAVRYGYIEDGVVVVQVVNCRDSIPEEENSKI